MKNSNFELKNILYLALPLIFSNLINAASSLISMYLLSQANTGALAAGAIITSTYGFIMMMVISMLYSVSIMVGKMHGASQHQEIGSIVFAGVIITITTGVPLTFLLHHMEPILIFLGQPQSASALAGEYFQGLAIGIIPSLIGAVYMQLFMGISQSRIILMLTAFGVIINSTLTYTCLFGYGPIPKMGVYGAGLASSMTAYILLTTTILYVIRSKKFSAHRLFHRISLNLKYTSILLKIGAPISIQYSAELLAFSALTYFMGIIGIDALSAQQISLQCSMVSIMIVMAISQAGSILISQSIGKNEPHRTIAIANSALSLGALIMFAISAIYWFYPTKIISLYLDITNPNFRNTIELTKVILSIAAFTQIFDSSRNITAGLLRGSGDTKSSMWTGIISCWVIGIPASILFGFALHFGAPGVRFGMMLGIMAGCINLLYRFYSKMPDDLNEFSYTK